MKKRLALRAPRFHDFLIVLLCINTAVLAVICVDYLKTRARVKLIEDVRMAKLVNEILYGENQIRLGIGIIQFLDNGFSLTLNSVSYDKQGLHLKGVIGNPKAVDISGLDIDVVAVTSFNPKSGKPRDKIGQGQTNVGNIASGKTAPFAIVLPNMKQDMEKPFQIFLDFKNERYSYD